MVTYKPCIENSGSYGSQNWLICTVECILTSGMVENTTG